MENLFDRDDYLSVLVDNLQYKDSERLSITLGELRKYKDSVCTWTETDQETLRRKAEGEKTRSLRLERISTELTDEQREKVLDAIVSYCYPYNVSYSFGSDALCSYFSQITGVKMSEAVFKELMKETTIKPSKKKLKNSSTSFYCFLMRDTEEVPPILRGRGNESWKYYQADEMRKYEREFDK